MEAINLSSIVTAFTERPKAFGIIGQQFGKESIEILVTGHISDTILSS